MIAKVTILLAAVALSQAGIIEPAWAPHNPTIIKQFQPTIIKKVIEAEAPANYQFTYDVNEPLTGDIKSQSEKAENGAIKGSYQLQDADGYLRVVRLTQIDLRKNFNLKK
jgi:Insect cuticle protein